MQSLLITALVLHVLTIAFWTGSTYTLTRLGGEHAEQLFPSQMGAAVVAFVTGGYLWAELHQGAFGIAEKLLAAAVVAAVLAASVQGAMIGGARRRLARATETTVVSLRRRMALAQRIAALFLTIALILMTAVRYV